MIFAICDCDAPRGPQKSPAISDSLHCDLRVRWKVASDLRFRVAISSYETPSFCGISGDLAPSTRKIASECDCAILVRKDPKVGFGGVPESRSKVVKSTQIPVLLTYF